MPDFNILRFRPVTNLVICAVFVITLSVPLVFQIFGIRFNIAMADKRKKTELPAFLKTNNTMSFRSVALFIDNFNSYYSDNFGLRELMIKFYLTFKINLLHTNPFPEKFVFGTEDWIFLSDSYFNAITETKGIKNFSGQELDEITKNIVTCEDYFELKKIKFFLAIAPEKSTVYGQKLPIKKSGRPTKLEQVKKRLSAIGFNLIDLKDDFNKNQNLPLYYKTDSHWNQIGVYYGYLTLMKAIGASYPMLKIHQFKDFSIDSSDHTYTGDMAKQLSLKPMECKYVLTPLFEKESIELPKRMKVPVLFSHDPKSYERRFENKNGKLKILIFRDSFFQVTYKFVAESFHETVFIWSIWKKDVIEQEKPDIVVFELAERTIDNLLYPLN